ncbi:heavy metal sensor histidine kinase [Candidatus Aalborgicola defluviihabitans]|uniref:heavy metal sensor histidine kinase n=1 Tax=Candidatus Aalborgicola defluviihabitans TaxID=3386187 RepID=UPI00390BA7D5|nr:heavy metal sensor histidine kinase [Burkholderiales bacterium]
MIKRLSLTARITLLFAVGSCAVLIALGWLIDHSIERHFEEQDHDALAGKMMLARHAIGRVATPQEFERLPTVLEDALIGHHDLVVQVLGPQKEVLLESPDVGFPATWQARGAAERATQLHTWTQGARTYRGMSQDMPTAIAAWQPLVVTVAVDIEHHQAFMHTFLQTLWLFVGCAAAATGLLGWFSVKRGLAPLRAMRDRAAGVTAHKLDQRLPVEALPPELAELAQSLNEMLARLEDAFQRLSDFSSDIAHELRTPVSNLMTQTQVSLSHPRDAASYREILESNAEEFERLARMISDMLFLAKTDVGQTSALMATNSVAVDLEQEVRGLFDFYEALAEENAVRLELSGHGVVQGDRLMLRRALSNLLSNALRYTPRGGTIQVVLECTEQHCTVTVENPGQAIPAQHLPRLFERFYRADPSRQQATGEGTGLGLAITHAIVQAHHGQVWATSTKGRTCFTIQLPPTQNEVNC